MDKVVIFQLVYEKGHIQNKDIHKMLKIIPQALMESTRIQKYRIPFEKNDSSTNHLFFIFN